MTNYIQDIYRAFHDLPETYELIIKGSSEGGYTFSASPTCALSVAIHTQSLFKQLFAPFPVQDVLNHYANSRLTKAHVRQVFVHMALFTGTKPPFSFHTLSELEQVFLDQAPQEKEVLEDPAISSGQGFRGLCEKIYLQWHHYFTIQNETDEEKIALREAEFLTSRLADRELQEGEYIYLHERSVFQVDHLIVGEGVYIAVLKQIDHPQHLKIVCRGTAMRPTATCSLSTGLNDIQYEIGNGGVQAAWSSLSTYLQKQIGAEVEIYGKSLGGAHAQRLALLVMKYSQVNLKGLTTVCSVGVGDEAESLFNEQVKADTKYQQLRVTVIRNGGDEEGRGVDYIPFVGGVHLGATVEAKYLDLRVYYVHPTVKNMQPPRQDIQVVRGGIYFVESVGPHIRQSTLRTFFYRLINEREAVQKELCIGRKLEGIRRTLAYKNTVPFTNFFQTPLAIAQVSTTQKVKTAVSIFFCLATLGGFIACLLLHPGGVLCQGGGVIFTVPALVLAVGTGVSVLVVSLHSCTWWLSARPYRMIRQ